MGVYDKILIDTYDVSQRATLMAAFLNNFDRISAEVYEYELDSTTYTGVKFTIDGSEIEGFYGYTDSCYYSAGYFVNGDIEYIAPFAAGRRDEIQGAMRIHAYSDEKCVMISIKDNSAWRCGIEMIFINDNESKPIVGYYKYPAVNGGTATYTDISNLTYECTTDVTRTQCTYTNMFPYTAPAGTLDFLAQSYFINDGVKKYTSKLLKECSTMDLLSTASLPSPLGNHLAIGAHCLAPLDDEGGDE